MIYVDNLQRHEGKRDLYAHLTADTRAELSNFASRLAIRRFHFGAVHVHYDVDFVERMRAIEAGAVEVSSREIVRRAPRQRRGLRGRWTPVLVSGSD